MKHQSYIRSLFVAFCAFFVCASAMAETTAEAATVHLNPFAYRIGNYKATNMVEKSGNPLNNDNFVINYALSGDATSVIVRFWNASSTWTRENGNAGATLLAEIDITNEKDSEGNDCYKKGYHTYTLDFTHVVGQSTTAHNQTLRWTIDVKGGNQAEDYTTKIVKKNQSGGTQSCKFINANEVTEYKGFRYPGSVDICNNPYDYNFGAVFCTESHVSDAGDDDTYVSHGESPGVYVFGGGMERLWANYHESDIACYGANFNSAAHFVSNDARLKALAPHRVRISDDGRVFVSVVEGRNNILKQITNPSNIDRIDQDKDGLYDDGGNFYEPDRRGGSYQDIFNAGTWNSNKLLLNTNDGKFIASPNVGMDIRNSGSELELLLLSANTQSQNTYTSNPTSGTLYPGINQAEWHLNRYKLGKNTVWGNAPSTEDVLEIIKNKHSLANLNHLINPLTATNGSKLGDAMLVGFNYIGLEYDLNGGCWIVQYRGNDGVAATMIHYNAKTQKVDFEEHIAGRTSGGVRHNHNFKKLAVAGGYKVDSTFTYKGAQYNGQKAREKYITIYSVTYNSSTGGYSFTDSAYIESNKGGFHDFAWDFADNLYATANGTNRLMAFALPHKDKTVSTPSMSQFNFKMSPVYAFNVAVSPTVAGADTYASVIHERIGKAPYPNYLHNALMNLRADVLTGCKFYKWTGQTGTHTTDGNKLVINNLASAQNITAQIGICAYDDTDILAVKKETTFPAAFVKRDMDNVSYSTICFPFDIATLTDELAGASVLKFTGTTIEKVENGCTHLKLQFEEVTFTGDDIIKAGIPYLIQPKNNITGEFTINRTVTCPANLDENGYGGKSVTYNGVTFHGLVKGAEFTPDENRLFLVANDRLANLTSTGSINGLRAFFTISVPSPVICEISLPNKTATSVPEVTTPQDGNTQLTKYMQDGQVFIQQAGQVFNTTGAHVK